VSVLRGIAHGLIAPFVSHRSFHVAGYQVTVPARSLFARQLAKYRAYEPVNSNWLVSRFSGESRGLFVDVGANFGWYSLLMASLSAEFQVVALEPSRENYELLLQNIKSNTLENIVALNVGAGSSSSTAALFVHERNNPGAHSIRPSSAGLSEEAIAIESLDALLEHYAGPVRLLKIDVEGYEVEVIRGAANTLKRTEAVLLEYSPAFLKECGHEPDELLNILGEEGFNPYLVRSAGLEPVALDRLKQCDPALASGHRWQVDLVFVRN
jgi:FkbM family methyltransferase